MIKFVRSLNDELCRIECIQMEFCILTDERMNMFVD